MNNKSAIKSFLLLGFTTLFISACAGDRIVKLEDSVEQLKNLDDYDSDGVIEAREKCDNTVLGASIDNYGCGTKTQKVEPFQVNVKFENNSYGIPESAYSRIKELADFLEKNQDIRVVIEGHTSKVGSVEFNDKLSKQRAEAVELMLKNKFNIAGERLQSVGYGFQRLEQEGQTEEAHAINRRILVELTYTEYLDDMEWTIYSVDQEL